MNASASDVLLAVLGTSVGLAGLLLVFSGFLFTQAEGFPPATTDDATIRRYKAAAKMGMWPFLASMGIALASMVGLFVCSRRLFYGILAGFVILLVATAIYGAVVIRRYL